MKAIYIGNSHLCERANRDRLEGFSFAVLFDRSLREDENDSVMQWASENLAGPIETNLREDSGLGPSGEYFFKQKEDALIFFLKYK